MNRTVTCSERTPGDQVRRRIAPLPAVYAAADKDLVCVLGPVAELNYPMFLLTHRDLRKIPRVKAVFEFCLRELKPVLLRGEMKK
jgi:hypothetical protein